VNGAEFDYVIVGAGSAGCVLANRLSAQPGVRVLLLEAGGPDSSPFIHMPAGIARLVDDANVDWRYMTEPEPALEGRRLYWPRGRVLGGSSSINAMCYTRGHPRDYDEWGDAAGNGWRYTNVLPFFLKAEDQSRGANAYHGSGGPLSVTDLKYRNPLSAVFVEAGRVCGLPYNEDFNGAMQAGVGFYQVTQRNGRRCSAALAYLEPARARGNLEVRTHCLAARVVFSKTRACGVEYRHRGALHLARAGREVLLAAGAIGSPQLLLLSGIGPADALRAQGVEVIADRAEVGAQLQDHLDFCTLYKCTKPITYDFSRWQEVKVALRYLLTRSGPGVSNVAEAGAFVRTRLAPDERPDVQLHFVPAQLDDHGRNRLPGHGFTIHACVLRPHSRGRLSLRSARFCWKASRCRVPSPRPRRLPNSAAPRSFPARASRRVARSRRSCAAKPRPSIIPRAPAAWGAIRMPSSMRIFGCAASKGCASWTPRSCRGSSAATPMRPPS
jgi:choline dehydrogenase